jgi:hypothetical protein
LYKCAVEKEDEKELPREAIQEMATWSISNTPINSTSFGKEVLSNQANSHFFERQERQKMNHIQEEVVIDRNNIAKDDDEISFDYTSIRDDPCCHPIV